MPKAITEYNVFIGSPGGLEEERKKFRVALEKCSRLHGRAKGVRFHAVAWEDTIGGVGRPQALINEDLKQCDYAVFVLHDRWGSSTGNGFTSGTEEEWALAEELYKANKLYNMALLFKKIDPVKLVDPGDQLKPVLAFKKKIESEKRYHYSPFGDLEEFIDKIDGYLAAWLGDHDKARSGVALSGQASDGLAKPSSNIAKPNFEFWISEAESRSNLETRDFEAAKYCARMAIDVAKGDIEWARARNIWGVAHFRLNNMEDSISAFAEIADKLKSSLDADGRHWCAKALVNKGVTLGALGRSDEAMAVYDDVVARFGAATEEPLCRLVARATANKSELKRKKKN